MAFEDSMIEEGFHDEGEYLNYLIDKAESFWQSQNEVTYEESFDYEEDEDNNEYEPEEHKEYRRWAQENPLLARLFYTWYKMYDFESRDMDSLVIQFSIWKSDMPRYIKEVENYYGDYFPRIISYFKWKLENKIENIIRFPDFLYLYWEKDPSYYEILKGEVEEYEEWLEKKKAYKAWLDKANKEEKKLLLIKVRDHFFKGDDSIENIKNHLINNMKSNDVFGTDFKEVIDWYNENSVAARNFYFFINCIEYYYIHSQEDE